MRDDQVRDYKLDEHEERLAALEAAVFGPCNHNVIFAAIGWCEEQIEGTEVADGMDEAAAARLRALRECFSSCIRLMQILESQAKG